MVNKNKIITVKLFDFIGHEKFNLTNENRNLTKIEYLNAGLIHRGYLHRPKQDCVLL